METLYSMTTMGQGKDGERERALNTNLSQYCSSVHTQIVFKSKYVQQLTITLATDLSRTHKKLLFFFIHFSRFITAALLRNELSHKNEA